ncbi:MAG: helix-turn-helix transcriptional regulator [Brevundimonas sp.]|nr:helix-turn-helix transcriptional regulator [Brevundimonas sp.]
MDWRARVGANILEQRKALGWSQQVLAGESGLSLRYLAGVERGEENPSLDTLIAVANALGASPASLFR